MRAEDERAIERLILTYARAADRLDGPLLRTIFAPDAEIDLGAIYRGGPEGFERVMLGFMGAMKATRHSVTNALIVFERDDRAAMESYVTAWHRIATPEGESELTVFGRYLDRAERRGDVWLLTRHSEVIDWGEERTVDGRWFDRNAEMEKGARDRRDRSYAYLPAVAE
jgi:hypothetical protein